MFTGTTGRALDFTVTDEVWSRLFSFSANWIVSFLIITSESESWLVWHDNLAIQVLWRLEHTKRNGGGHKNEAGLSGYFAELVYC